MVILKKGQSSMEFLMTYGWAILAVILALTALFFSGIFNNKEYGENCFISPGFSCSFSASSNSISLEVQNSLGTRIDNIRINVTELISGTCTQTTLTKLDDGEKTLINLDCNNLPNKLKANVKLEYAESGKILPRVINGQITGITQSNITGQQSQQGVPDINDPIVTLNSPVDGLFVYTNNPVTFSCSATDDVKVNSVSLYGNFSGPFVLQSNSSSSNPLFSIGINPGTYRWNCQAYDNSSNNAFASSNYTITQKCGNGVYDPGELCGSCPDTECTQANCGASKQCFDGACGTQFCV